MAREGRGIIVTIIKNFIETIKPRQFSGSEIGKDHLGNTYYEIPVNAKSGNRRRERWFTPKEKDNFEQEIPAEWEAWLRGRRREPPPEEEVIRNLVMMQMKKEKAKKIAEREAALKDSSILVKEVKGMESFPVHKEYEIMPGKPQDNSK